jgi:hypothetical protein
MRQGEGVVLKVSVLRAGVGPILVEENVMDLVNTAASRRAIGHRPEPWARCLAGGTDR